jgi:hypothetical protein
VADRFDLVLASVDGDVLATSQHRVLLYEQVGGETNLKVPGSDANVYNLTAQMLLFSPEYLIEFFNDGVLYRGPKIPWWIDHAVYYLAGSLALAIGLYWAVIVPIPGQDISVGIPREHPHHRTEAAK